MANVEAVLIIGINQFCLTPIWYLDIVLASWWLLSCHSKAMFGQKACLSMTHVTPIVHDTHWNSNTAVMYAFNTPPLYIRQSFCYFPNRVRNNLPQSHAAYLRDAIYHCRVRCTKWESVFQGIFIKLCVKSSNLTALSRYQPAQPIIYPCYLYHGS